MFAHLPPRSPSSSSLSEDEHYFSSSSSCTSTSSSSSSSRWSRTGTKGTYRVRYDPRADWDFALETSSTHEGIDVELALPHYRARSQPLSHRMSLGLAAVSGPVKAKIVRAPTARVPFYLDVDAHSSPVTLWLPSTFAGTIRHTRNNPPALSPGFSTHVLPHARISPLGTSSPSRSSPASTYAAISHDEVPEDEVVIRTSGRVELRIWDVALGAPEKSAGGKGAFRKMIFGAAHGHAHAHPVAKKQQGTIDWDFLLED